MKSVEIIAQSVGMIAMLFNILSYQSKQQRWIIALQLCGSAFFCINYLLLGATVGGLLNILASVRAVVFLFKEKLKADRLPWLFAFGSLYVAVYIFNFTVFGKEPTLRNLVVEILPVIGMIALNIGYRLKSASDVRRCGLISSPAWLIYNIVSGSWGAIACEVLTLGSIVLGILRHDKKTSKTETHTNHFD